MTFQANSSRLQHHESPPPIYNLKHDINYLLSCYNQLDRKNIGFITKQSARIFFRSIDINNYEPQLMLSQKHEKNEKYQKYEKHEKHEKHEKYEKYDQKQGYQFDHILSILGKIQVPQQPSIYVLSFIRILSQFRNKCIAQSQQQPNGLIQAGEIQKKIKKIINKEIQRQISRLQLENKKSYQEMEWNQDKQLKVFEDQWSSYLGDYSTESKKKVKQTIQVKNRSLEYQQTRFIKTARRYSILTSSKLTQLQQRKKRLVNYLNKINNPPIKRADPVSTRKSKLFHRIPSILIIKKEKRINFINHNNDSKQQYEEAIEKKSRRLKYSENKNEKHTRINYKKIERQCEEIGKQIKVLILLSSENQVKNSMISSLEDTKYITDSQKVINADTSERKRLTILNINSKDFRILLL